MKLNSNLFIVSTLLPWVPVSSKGSGGSRGSSGGGSYGGSSSSSGYGSSSSTYGSSSSSSSYGGSKPSGSSYNSKPGPSPTTSTTNRAPSSGGGNYGPTYSSTDRSYSNPNPAYKPTTPAGAPTLANGGGGYSYNNKAPSSGGGYSTGALVGAAAGGVLLGSFLYGGMHSSPGCRGGYGYSSSCNYGTSTASHQCPSQIPLCGIPQSIQDQWYLGSTPQVEVIADKSTCSSDSPNLKPPDDSDTTTDTTTTTTTPPPTAAPTLTPNDIVNDNAVDENVTTTTAMAGRSDNVTTADEEVSTTTNNANTFTLADCMVAVMKSGTCEDAKRFTYDEISGKCQCCGTGADLIPWEYSSAVYVYSASNPLESSGAPQYCVSGSTLYYPTQNTVDDSLSDQTYQCECGDCTQCGNPQVSYMDWSGPFVVPTALGESATSPVSDKPLYDPVGTCTCNTSGEQCPEQQQSSGVVGGGGGGGNIAVVATTTAASLFLGLLL